MHTCVNYFWLGKSVKKIFLNDLRSSTKYSWDFWNPLRPSLCSMLACNVDWMLFIPIRLSSWQKYNTTQQPQLSNWHSKYNAWYLKITMLQHKATLKWGNLRGVCLKYFVDDRGLKVAECFYIELGSIVYIPRRFKPYNYNSFV